MKKTFVTTFLFCLFIFAVTGYSAMPLAKNKPFIGSQKTRLIRSNSLVKQFLPTGCLTALGLLFGRTFYDTDCQSDFTIWRDNGEFWTRLSSQNLTVAFPYGQPGDQPLSGDYDNDGITDLAVYRIETGQGWWYFYNSTQPSLPPVKFGADPYDMPIPADYNGDGRTDVAVFRVEEVENCQECSRQYEALFYCDFSPGKLCSPHSIEPQNTLNILPVVEDYDGDGTADIAIRRQDSGKWIIKTSGGLSMDTIWGPPGTIPLPGNYASNYTGTGTADGVIDLAVWDRDTGTWHIQNSGGGTQIFQFGISSDQPVPADYDGDGITDIAVRRPNLQNGSPLSYYYVLGSSVGYFIIQFGLEDDQPVGFPKYIIDPDPPSVCPTGMCKDLCPIVC